MNMLTILSLAQRPFDLLFSCLPINHGILLNQMT